MSGSGWRQPWFLAMSHALHHVLAVPLAPLLLLVQADLGTSLALLGVAISAGELCGGLVQVGMGLAADRWGRRQVLLGGFLVQAAALVLIARAGSLWVLAGGTVLLGLGNSTYHPASFALVAAERTAKVNTRFAFHNSLGLVGTALSYSIYTMLAAAFGWRDTLAGMAGVAALFTLVLAANVREVRPEAAAARPAPVPAANGPGAQAARRLAFFSIISGGFIQGLAYLLPAFLVLAREFTLERANHLVTVLFLIAGAGTLLGGRWVDRVGEVRAMLVGGLAAAVLVLVLVYLPAGTAVTLVVMGCLGFGQALARTALSGVTAKLGSGGHGGLFGLQFAALYLGGALGVPLLGWVADRWGTAPALALLAPLLAVYGFAALMVRGREAA